MIFRSYEKGRALADACNDLLGSYPSRDLCLLFLGVAEHETLCGDAWGKAHNWGGIQRRQMTAAEKSIVDAGEEPPPKDDFEILRGDTSPLKGKYQAWFWKFPNDRMGAEKFVRVLVLQRPDIHMALNALNSFSLAKAMYQSHYFEGAHDPRPGKGEHVERGGLTIGQVENISEYASAVEVCRRRFNLTLGTWEPYMQGWEYPQCVRDLQSALFKLGCSPGTIDGIYGKRTIDAIIACQKKYGLQVTGFVDPAFLNDLHDLLKGNHAA